MPQLHFYVPEDIADAVRRRAQARNMPVSRYLAEIVRREVAGWPEEFAGALGAWQGDDPPLPGSSNSKRERK